MSIISSARYSRQSILSEIGLAGQDRLSTTSVLIVGAGGLGCPALLYLAGAGLGTIGIIDHDQVDISNLQRQVLFSTEDQGRLKADAAKERLLNLNPEIKIVSYAEELTGRNAVSLLSGYDIIVDGTDNFAAKFLINDVAVKLGKPVVYGAIQCFEAQVSVFFAAKGPCYRCLYPRPPQGLVMNCAEAGVIGALAGIAGTMQAMEVVKLAVSHPSFEPLIGRLWMIDATTMETRIISIPKRDDCPVCSRPEAEIIPQYASPVCSAPAATEITCTELAVMPDAVLFDVREQDEWDRGHIEGAQHLPLSVLQRNPDLFTPPKTGNAVLYCQRGMRSLNAATLLHQAGFLNLYSLTGGYEAWCASHR